MWPVGKDSWVAVKRVDAGDTMAHYYRHRSLPRRSRYSTGVKKVGRKTYKVAKSGGAWLVYHAGKLVALMIRNIVYTFSREVGKSLARKILAAK